MSIEFRNILKNHFGFTQFRPGQEEALNSLAAGNNTLVVMPTGSGKSLIYQLMALELPGITLVISPLIALMKNQVDQLQKHAIPATFINSSLPRTEQMVRQKAMQDGAYKIVFVAPERLRSFSFWENVNAQHVSLLAVDEAHCISEWGHDFRPDYLEIAGTRKRLGFPLTVALTATATPKVQYEILNQLKLDRAQKIITGFNRPNLTFDVNYTNGLVDKLHALKRLVLPNDEMDQGGIIIYTGTRREAEETCDFLHQVCNLEATYYHAGLTSEERTNVQEAFLSRKCNLVVATNAFGMGIDRADVRMVIHFNMPGSLEAYYQQAGRSGRDGFPAVVILFYDPKDHALHEWFIDNSNLSFRDLSSLYKVIPNDRGSGHWFTSEDFSLNTGLNEIQVRLGLSLLERSEALIQVGDDGLRTKFEKKTWNTENINAGLQSIQVHQAARKAQLKRMVQYAESNHCRRRIILDYFGDRGDAEAADCCDNCRFKKNFSKHVFPAKSGIDGELKHGAKPGLKVSRQAAGDDTAERVALVILDAVLRLKRKIGRTTLASILAGSKASRIKDFAYDQHTYYGRLAYIRKADILEMIDALVQKGYFKIIGGKYPVISLTPKGEVAIKHKENINLDLPERVRKKSKKHHEFSQQFVNSKEINVNSYQAAQEELEPANDSSVNEYLNRPHPRPLPGPWKFGWALGFHSGFSGDYWQRSQVGEWTYRLKYQEDLGVLSNLVDQTLALFRDHPEVSDVDLILPVPPSQVRRFDPVGAYASALSLKIGIEASDALQKSRHTAQQKEFSTLAAKKANIAGAFVLHSSVKGKRCLVVDDLFDSGSTMVEVTHVLEKAGAASVNVLTLTRTIHTEK